MDARKGRGAGNGSGKKWDDVPPVKTNECPHNRIVWGAEKKCKDCGETIKS